MAQAMKPLEDQVIQQEKYAPGPPGHAYIKRSKPITKCEKSKKGTFAQQHEQGSRDAQNYIIGDIPSLV
jgi:hypothetical protein